MSNLTFYGEKFGIPPFFRCVYKINYDGGFYYIGSSVCLRKRIMAHVRKSKDRKIISVEVLKVIENETSLRQYESDVILACIGDEMCLNKYSKPVYKPGRKAGLDNKIPITVYIESSVLRRFGKGDIGVGKRVAVGVGSKAVYDFCYKTA